MTRLRAASDPQHWTEIRCQSDDSRHFRARRKNAPIAQSGKRDASTGRMPQKEAVRFTPTRIADLPTKPSRSRHLERKFASDGGTSSAARPPSIEKFFCAPGRDPRTAPARPGRAQRGSASTCKSALRSRSCSRSCPTVRLTPKSRMIKSRVRKRCVNSMSSAVSSPLARRCGARAERTAEFLQSPRNSAKTDGAAERSTRFRGGHVSSWTDFACSSHPDFVQRAHLRAARERLTPGRVSGSKHACSNTAHFLRGMA